MAVFVFQGHQPVSYPQYLHPEQDGVLTAEPGELVDFGDASPPPDGNWYDVSSGRPYLGQSPAEDDEDDQGGPGTESSLQEED